MTFGELVWNVSWNQRLHKVCAYGGLGGAHVQVLPMFGSEGYSSRLAHIAKSATYAPPQTGRMGSASADFRERSRNVPWNQRLHKMRAYRGLGGRRRGG